MLGEDGRARVMDFGLASGAIEVAEDQTEALTLDSRDRPLRLTRTGALVGTPAYMSPEQLNGQSADARSDQFGFAVSLYEALHGCRPFRGKTVRELRAAIVSGEFARGPRSAAVPSWLDRLLARALAVNPEDRFPSMSALLEALDDDPVARRLDRLKTQLQEFQIRNTSTKHLSGRTMRKFTPKIQNVLHSEKMAA